MIKEDSHVYVKDFGTPVSITLSNNSVLSTDSNGNPLLGIFDNCYLNPELGNVTITASIPLLTIPTIDIVNVKEQNVINISGVNYKIAFINNDGTGMSTLELAK